MSDFHPGSETPYDKAIKGSVKDSIRDKLRNIGKKPNRDDGVDPTRDGNGPSEMGISGAPVPDEHR